VAEKQAVHVTVFNQTYTLRVSGDEREVLDLADSVDQLMHTVASRSGTADSLRVAVLACLHLADRLRSLEKDLASLKRRVDAKSVEFGALLEEVLGERQSPATEEHES
jgi:cell division protein ZapA